MMARQYPIIVKKLDDCAPKAKLSGFGLKDIDFLVWNESASILSLVEVFDLGSKSNQSILNNATEPLQAIDTFVGIFSKKALDTLWLLAAEFLRGTDFSQSLANCFPADNQTLWRAERIEVVVILLRPDNSMFQALHDYFKLRMKAYQLLLGLESQIVSVEIGRKRFPELGL